ncbi:hypothetical protein ACOJVU_15690 [Mycobacterium sp. THU-M104]|uniref:hypothetical protein n=1 Tax=Mycobacterium sp. THU-M104 TaxID=3410515 RepID=UPI003B9CDB39
MDVGRSVARSLDHWERRQWDEAMVHAGNAVDETATKRHPRLGIAVRFKRTLRDSLDVFRAMAAPGVDLGQSRFPVAVRSDLPDHRPDIADVLYGIHRWNRGHHDELPNGYELTPRGPRPSGVHIWRDGKIELPASVVIGLLAVAVFAPENKGEAIPAGYQLSWHDHVFHIAAWWGWQDHFREIVGAEQIPQTTLEFGAAWHDWSPKSL